VNEERLLFGQNKHIERDVIYNSHVTSDQYDKLVDVHLQVLLPTMCKICKKRFASHLPGDNINEFKRQMK